MLAQCSLGKEVTAARKAKLIACKRSGTSEGTSNTDFTRGKLLLQKKNQICRNYKHCRTAVHKMKYFLNSVYYLFDVKKNGLIINQNSMLNVLKEVYIVF